MIYDYSQVPQEALDEFLRQGEIFLENTIKLGISADSRATTSSNIYGAAAIAAFALAFNLSSTEHPHVPLIAAVISAAVFLALASAFCALAARPQSFFVGGYEPEHLYPIAEDEVTIKRVVAADIQERIDANRQTLLEKANQLRSGQGFAALAPVAFISTYMTIYLSSH